MNPESDAPSEMEDAESWIRRATHGAKHLVSHDHEHGSGTERILDSGEAGIRATKVSLLILGIDQVRPGTCPAGSS